MDNHHKYWFLVVIFLNKITIYEKTLRLQFMRKPNFHLVIEIQYVYLIIYINT